MWFACGNVSGTHVKMYGIKHVKMLKITLLQDKAKELELLCNLKALEFIPLDLEKTVGKLMYVNICNS